MKTIDARVTPRALFDALMRDVYVPFSACVCLDADGQILSIWQFDAAFCARKPVIAPDTREVWLISNHPEGNMRPEPEDVRCAGRLREQLGGAALRTFIASEDEGCREIEY